MNKVLGQALPVTDNNAPIAMGTTEAQNKKTQDDYTPNSSEFKEAVLSLFSEKSLFYPLAELMLEPAGLTVLDAFLETGTLACNARLCDMRKKVHIHEEPFTVTTRRGKQARPKRHWIRECDQSWWDSESKCFIDDEP